jgi:hypothetical protein
MAGRSIAGRMVKTAARRAWTRFMDRVGGKLVSGIADTSSDAPDARYEPKRNLYAQMQAEQERSDSTATDEDADSNGDGTSKT